MAITFRDYQPDDAAVLPQLLQDALHSVYPDFDFSDWTKDLEDMPRHFLNDGAFVVGLDRDRVVAMGGLAKIDDYTGELRWIMVEPSYQSQGLGRQIVARLEDRARARGFRMIKLDTAYKQVAAQHLYESMGYKLFDRKIADHGISEPLDTFYYQKELA